VTRILPVVALVLVVAAAVVASTLLLAAAGGDTRVGDLGPVAPGISSAPVVTATTAPTATDDHHGGHGDGRLDDEQAPRVGGVHRGRPYADRRDLRIIRSR
jgi:hypothetical protein